MSGPTSVYDMEWFGGKSLQVRLRELADHPFNSVARDTSIECADAAELIERQATELATAADELHELRTENMRLRHQVRETAAIHDRLAAELVTAQASTDRLLNQCARQRALLDDVRNSSVIPKVKPRHVLVTVWLERATWDALHAIGGES